MKVKVFMSSANNPSILENEINIFIEQNGNIKVKDIKFSVSFFYDQKADGYNGGYAALLMYEEKTTRKYSSN